MEGRSEPTQVIQRGNDAEDAPLGARLVVISSADAGRMLVLGEKTTVGRSDQRDLHLSAASVSKRHARVMDRDGRYFVVDLESTNGTLVNGRSLSPNQETELTSGDVIHFGDVSVLFLGASRSRAFGEGPKITVDFAAARAEADEALSDCTEAIKIMRARRAR